MQPTASDHPFRSAVKHGWIRFVGAARPNGRFQLPRRRRPGGALPFMAEIVDPVELTVMALTILATAVHRANTTGKKVTVTVPDEQTGAIFRAALRESQRLRPGDRLIDIVTAKSDETDAPAHGSRRPH